MPLDPTSPPPHPMLLVAGAGYGKTTWLERHCPPDGRVGSAVSLLAEGIGGARWVGVDDLDELPVDDQVRLLGQVGAATGVAIASREPLAPAVRDRICGPLGERGPVDLALSPYAVSRVLAHRGIEEPTVAMAIADLTAGWPALVQLAADLLSRDPHVPVQALSAADAPAVTWLQRQVLSQLSQAEYAVLTGLAGLAPRAPITAHGCAELLEALGVDALAPAAVGADIVSRLRTLGVVLPRRTVAATGRLYLVPQVAEILRTLAAQPIPAGTSQRVGSRHTVALAAALARAHEQTGDWLAVATCQAAAGAADRVADLLGAHGESILRGGAADFAQLVDAWCVEPASRPMSLQVRYVDAQRLLGDPAAAERAAEVVRALAGRVGWTPGAAACVAAIAYLQGDPAAAVAALGHWTGLAVAARFVGEPDHPAEHAHRETDGAAWAAAVDAAVDCWGIDTVEWLSTRVHALSLLGRSDEAAPCAAAALRGAERLDDPRALAPAELALARTVSGARKDQLHEQALHHATLAGDGHLAARVLAVATHELLAQARYAEAVPRAREALRVARLCSPPGLQAAALHNLGEALGRVGQVGEARWHLECAIAVCRRLGPARAALALTGLGDLHRALGHEELSRLAYLEAVELSRDSGDTQVLVAALSGLAILGADDPGAEHDAAAAEALHRCPALLSATPLTALARLALGRGQRHTAAQLAEQAVAVAREHRALDHLAEALEVAALAAATPARARDLLTEALAIWSVGGAAPAVARTQLLLGRLPGADPAQRAQARAAARVLTGLGIHRVHGRPVHLVADAVPLSIRVLGPFAAHVDGQPIPLPGWRSRQARVLVKVLVASRGGVVSRERLCDLLWPDDDPARTGHRLSVLLTTVRRVLDPGRCWPSERYLVADATGIRLDLSAVTVDSESLLRDAAHAEALLAEGELDAARELLQHVDALYRGAAFDDEPDAPWADGLREHVRAVWIRAVRRLIVLMVRDGRPGDTVALLVRLLTVDPYDDQVHRRLVSTLVSLGRHGEARRAFGRWRRAMREIDAPTPDPRILAAAATAARPAPTVARDGDAAPSRVTRRADLTLTAS